MTVKQPANDLRYQDNSDSDLRKSKEFLSLDDDKIAEKKFSEREADRILNGKLKVFMELETDQESIGSSEDTESPRSVAKVGQWTPKKIARCYLLRPSVARRLSRQSTESTKERSRSMRFSRKDVQSR
ncbi:hypothetical protein F0562_004424 [Nyssa sinensis]|uniref:Uncharacterized protein n=1 Tax=Nyssa sinensis TaxID=561372 RepID=A0A5J5BY24_9ASTE|nr:hypothetical protein F0562_004424 [Nyssa sinensis]